MMGETMANATKVSDAGTKMEDSDEDDQQQDELDELVRRASTPNLAALFKRGKEAGLIKPGKEYGSS